MFDQENKTTELLRPSPTPLGYAPTGVIDSLRQRQAELKQKLAVIETALADLDKHPEFAETLQLLTKALHV